MLRKLAWHMLYLRHKAPRERILLSSMDVANAYRQVARSWNNGPKLGYPFGGPDRGGSAPPPSGGGIQKDICCLFSATLEHSHTNTTMANAVVPKAGKQAISHVTVSAPGEGERPQRLPRG